jgi:hypothetical protein
MFFSVARDFDSPALKITVLFLGIHAENRGNPLLLK